MKEAQKGWSQLHALYNSNGFYFAHPEIRTESVDVVFPPEMAKVAQWQAERSMFTAMPEVRWLADILLRMDPPKAVLDIACGVGRCSVYLAKRFGWDAEFLMYDSTGMNPTYGALDNASESTVYNDLALTSKYLTLNNVRHLILDAKQLHLRYRRFTVDLAYSFMAFGFHFGINEVLPYLEDKVRLGGLAIFGTRGFDAGAARFIRAGYIVDRLNYQLSLIDQRKWRIIRDARGPERLKCSVIVLERREGGRQTIVPPEVEE